MKKKLILFFVLTLFFVLAITPTAADALVSFKGHEEEIEFYPGSIYSDSDLFGEFKNVMPGDTLSQRISVKHVGESLSKARIYMRALGAEEGSEEFLSKLRLTVISDNKTLFDARADETDGLQNWTHIGTLSKGEWVDLDVTLFVPTDLDNSFENKIGYLDWEFMVEEIPTGTIPLNPSRPDYVSYRVEANYYTDDTLDNPLPLTLYANRFAKKLPQVEEIVLRYSEAHRQYGEHVYNYTGTEFDSKTNTFTIRYDRTETPPPPQPVYLRYTVMADYYTNGTRDASITLFVSGDVEALPDIREVEKAYRGETHYGGCEYEYTEIKLDESTSTYTLSFHRTYTPQPPTPDTGDNSILSLWLALLVGALVMMLIFIVLIKKKKDENK